MLPQIVFYALQPIQTCQTGQCPQQVAPTVSVSAATVPYDVKTVVQYRRNLFGRLVPVQATTTSSPAKRERNGK